MKYHSSLSVPKGPNVLYGNAYAKNDHSLLGMTKWVDNKNCNLLRE